MINKYLNTLHDHHSLLCHLFGHQYKLTQKVNNHFKEYQCERCQYEATLDEDGKKVALTEERKDINKTLYYLNIKRTFLAHFYSIRTIK